MSLLLAIAGAEAVQGGTGGVDAAIWLHRLGKKRKSKVDWLDQWLRKDEVTPQFDELVAKRADDLKVQIAEAKQAQTRAQNAIAEGYESRAQAALQAVSDARLAAKARRIAEAQRVVDAQRVAAAQRIAEAQYAAAVQAEAIARQKLKDLDIAFVAAVLMEM